MIKGRKNIYHKCHYRKQKHKQGHNIWFVANFDCPPGTNKVFFN